MKSPGLQELFLSTMSRERIPATFFLVNGFQLRGLVKAFDDYTVVVECGAEQELIFKHAISTIIPIRHVQLD